MFCRLLFVLLYFFSWSLCCLFFLDIRILITPLVYSNSSYNIAICLWFFIQSLWTGRDLHLFVWFLVITNSLTCTCMIRQNMCCSFWHSSLENKILALALLIEWLNDWCLTPNLALFGYIVAWIFFYLLDTSKTIRNKRYLSIKQLDYMYK